ncbi:2-dehydropantoate 2-reductase (Ketopantoate reductase) (KPA reductase) (KPR) [Sporothrix epigloea]|uniref:2-dehydropantoate 2-reductase (Ketopantoate reductase) (KPA reductase) (KPR) n=1 Tax=Sporothrix epigloea TaxID=1892477 RepID=A0ABP0DNN9_9PEZI
MALRQPLTAVPSVARLCCYRTWLSCRQRHEYTTSAAASKDVGSSTTTAVPAWLSRVLHDKAPAPQLYRWTPDDVAGQRRARRADRAALDDSRKRIYIVGMGNLGRLFAATLASLPNRPPITLVVHRSSLLEQWRSAPGVTLHPPGYVDEEQSQPDSSAHIADFDIEMWSETPPPATDVLKAEISPIKNLIIATKAQDALQTADWVRRYLGPDSAVAFAQNGMNKLWPPYGAIYSKARYGDTAHSPLWLACVVTHGVYSVGPFASVHASPADVVVGAVDNVAGRDTENVYLVSQILAASQLAARLVPRHVLWVLQLEKLVINAVINPLTAILRCKNGALFSVDTTDDEAAAILARVIDQLLAEASAVLRELVQHEIKTGSIFVDSATSADASVAALLERFSFTSLRALIYRVGELVKDNSSSMYQDAQAGKKTEVGEFNGWIVDMARYLESVAATDGTTLDVTGHQTVVDLVEKAVVMSKEELGNHFIRQ